MSETFAYQNLIGGDFPRVTAAVTLKSGTSYKAGAVLGIITTGGKAVLVDSSKSDGSQTPYGVLTEDVDATSADKVSSVYLSGEFVDAALSFGGTDTAATHKAALRDLNIYVKTAVAA